LKDEFGSVGVIGCSKRDARCSWAWECCAQVVCDRDIVMPQVAGAVYNVISEY